MSIDLTQRYDYCQECSRCGGTGTDPEDPEDPSCVCDVCEDGIETLSLTEDEAQRYPNAVRAHP